MGGRDASQEMGLEDQWALVSPHLELRQQEGQMVGAESEKAAAGSPLQAPCLATTSWKQSSEDVRKEQLGTKSVRGDMRSRLASSHTCN